ncbi:MAG: AraC family transcriptional regulator [Lentisphaeria bacterium]
MQEFPFITVEKQTHPGLSPVSPVVFTHEYSEEHWHNFKADSHYALQISMVLRGEAEVVMTDYRHYYHAGEMWWTMCWEPHAYRMASRRTFVLAVNVDMEFLGGGLTFDHSYWLLPFIINPKFRFNPSTDEERKYFLNVGKELYHLNAQRPRNWRTAAWLKTHYFILKAVNTLEKRYPEMVSQNGSGYSFSRIQTVLRYIWQKKMPPSLADASKLCALGTSRFSELFRRNMGVSYGKFALHVRMANASRDLLSGNLTLDEISSRWGFYDAAHFCHTFRKFYKVSPGEFKAR